LTRHQDLFRPRAPLHHGNQRPSFRASSSGDSNP
jgi:hypothetical protein